MRNERELLAITAPVIFNGETFLDKHCVILQGSSIANVLPTSQCPEGCKRYALDQGTLAPGLIDLQVNGGGGVLFNENPSPKGIQILAAAHRNLGTTSLLPTVISDRPQVIQAAVNAVQTCLEKNRAGIAGLHIEGPHFEPARRGAHSEEHIRKATEEDIDWLCSLSGLPLIVTLAPEHVAVEQIARLSKAGVIVCAGHTNATGTHLSAATDAGLRGVTHLYNAMSGPTAREPGTVGATLAEDRLWAGIIADGHHVHPDNIRVAQHAKPAGKLVLVSDAMATVGAKEKAFRLYGEDIVEEQGRLVNARGVLAGSAICLMDAVEYCTTVAGLAMDECLRMASLYPAQILGLEHELGRLAPGFRADMVHFDEHFQVHNTWLAGQHLASKSPRKI